MTAITDIGWLTELWTSDRFVEWTEFLAGELLWTASTDITTCTITADAFLLTPAFECAVISKAFQGNGMAFDLSPDCGYGTFQFERDLCERLSVIKPVFDNDALFENQSPSWIDWVLAFWHKNNTSLFWGALNKAIKFLLFSQQNRDRIRIES